MNNERIIPYRSFFSAYDPKIFNRSHKHAKCKIYYIDNYNRWRDI